MFMGSGFLSMAVNDFAKAVELDPALKAAWLRQIEAQLALQDYNAAEKTANRAIIKFPQDTQFFVLLGETHLQKSEFSQAKKIFEQLPSGGARDFYLGLMHAYFEENARAQELLAAARTNPQFTEKSNVLLGAYEEHSLFPEGNNLHLRLLLSKAFNNLHFYELSVQSTKAILKDRDDYRDAWIILGHSYLALNRNDLAKNVLTKALELDPTKPETSFFLGLAESAMGDFDNAITHLSMARENGYSPQQEATQALAEAFLEGEYYDAAREEYEKLLEIRNVAVDKFVQPVRISIEFLDDPAAAVAISEKAVERYEDSPTAKNLLAWSLLENNELDRSEEILRQLLEDNESYAPARLNLGRVLEAREQYEQAMEELKTAYELNPHTEVGALAAERYNAITRAVNDLDSESEEDDEGGDE
jgi:tetratricopeptide (TPR) repeat protein